MPRLGTAWRWTIEVVAWISRIVTVVMMLLITFEVIARKFFGFSLVGTVETVSALMVVIVFLGWSYAESKGAHVAVTFLTERLGSNTRSVLEAITILVMLGIFSIMIWQTTLYALDAWRVGLLYETAKVPIFPFRAVVPIGIFFLCLQLVIKLVSSIARLLPTRT